MREYCQLGFVKSTGDREAFAYPAMNTYQPQIALEFRSRKCRDASMDSPSLDQPMSLHLYPQSERMNFQSFKR
jgi:hypothetical protein